MMSSAVETLDTIEPVAELLHVVFPLHRGGEYPVKDVRDINSEIHPDFKI